MGTDSFPSGWVAAKVSDFATLVTSGSRDWSKYYADSGALFIRTQDIKSDLLTLDTVPFVSLPNHVEGKRSLVEPGDLLVTITGNVGRCALVENGIPEAYVSQSVALIKLGRNEVAPYLHKVFLAPASEGKRVLEAIAYGLGRQVLNLKQIRDFEFPLPPLNEQRRIVAKLQELTARSRRAREALEAVPPLLEQLRQSVLAAAFSGRLTADWREKNKEVEPASVLLERIRTERRRRWEENELAKLHAKGKEPKDDHWKAKYKEPGPVDPTGRPDLPEGWCWVSLDEISWDARYGTSEKCDYEAPGSPVLRIPNVAGNRIHLGDMKNSVSDLQIDSGDELQPGDFLIVRTNGSRDLIGRAAVVQESFDRPTYFASYLIRYRLVRMEALPGWLALIWQSTNIRSHLETLAATSAGQFNVSLSKLSSVVIPLPPEEEMKQLLIRADATLSGAGGIDVQVTESHEAVDSLDQSILARAFRGELVPQDPNDEPASVLLDRIRSQRTAEVKTKSKKNRSLRKSG